MSTNPKQRPEGIERIEAAVEAEGELVEIGLQMLGANAVMDAVQSRLQVAEGQMDD